MTMQTIESQDMSLGQLFNDFYVVPDYQREYVWQATQVENLLQDINNEYDPMARAADSEYFIGSTVACLNSDGTYEVIDGQQRLTTAFLVLCAIRDRLKELKVPPIGELEGRISSLSIDANGDDVHRYRVALQYQDSLDVLERIASQGGVDGIDDTTRSISNIRLAYETIYDFLKSTFGEDASTLKRFYVYLTQSVKLIRVKTVSVAHALKVFETVNDRGVSLNSMDLLKNLLFQQSDRNQFDQLNGVWKELVDTLFRAGEKPLRFLRYYIFSTYTVDRLREDEIYDWFMKNHSLCGYRDNPITFAQQLSEAAKIYTRFVHAQDPYGAPNKALANIRNLSRSAHQHFILLLAARHTPQDVFAELSRHLENLFFAYTIARESTRDFERRFAQWAPRVRKINNMEDLQGFLAQDLTPAKQDLALRFDQNLSQLREFDVPKYRLRYILAKITQYVDDSAWSTTTDLNTYLGSEVDVEHILPQNPKEEVKQSFGQPDDIRGRYTRRLGNLTLLEKSIDASIGNGLFQRKQPAYTQSKFLVTKSLGGKLSVGENTKYDRAVAPLLVLDAWTTASIDSRQKMLTDISHRVWNMPKPDGAE